MKKGIIYSRVSTVNQDTTRQENELKEYAKRNEIEIIEVFTDITSGTTKAERRTGAKGMLDFLEHNHIDMVLVSEISRLARNAFEAQKLINHITVDSKINMYIDQQGLKAYNKNGTPNIAFKIVTDVLANVAQMEREHLSERTKSGLRQAVKDGKTLGRRKGTTKDNKTLLTQNKDVVRELKNGLSIRKTAKLCDVSPSTVQKVKAAMTA